MPPSPRDALSSLGQAQEQIYSENAQSGEVVDPLTPRPPVRIQRSWGSVAFGAPRHVRFASSFFVTAFVFCILALGAAGLLFFTGTNTVSTGNIDLAFQGPTSVAGGDALPLSVTITNKNPVTITNAHLEINFPEGTRSADDLASAYPRYVEDLGTLAPGGTVERSVRAVLFGTQDAHIAIPASLSYGTQGSNATFVKKTSYTVTISTAPLSVALDTVSEVVAGKPFTITVTVRSNATAPLAGVVLSAQYPNGFLPVSSSPASVGTNFSLGTLLPGDEKKITLTGILGGQDGEAKSFHFSVGTAKSANDPVLAVAYMTQDATVVISAPFLATTLTVNGSGTETPVVTPGATVTAGVNWINALTVPVQNAQVEVALSGSAFDPNTIRVPNGFYRSSDNTVVFNRDTNPTLGNLSPGASGSGTFTFNTARGVASRNASVVLTLSVAGTRAGQTGVPEQISASATKTIKIASVVSLTTTPRHSTGPFSNFGPVPPKTDLPTTYTIEWTVANSGNELADTSVVASLPSYVTFTGSTQPADGSLTYDASSRTLTWKAGDISAGASRQAAFQVAITPSTSQKTTIPALTLVPTFSGFDRFVQAQIVVQGNAATTETKSDQGYTILNAIVQ